MVKQHKKISGKSAIVKGLKQMELRPEKSTLHWPPSHGRIFQNNG